MCRLYLRKPSDAKPTGEAGDGIQYSWKLNVSAKLPGVDFRCEFEAYVFRENRDGEVSAHGGSLR